MLSFQQLGMSVLASHAEGFEGAIALSWLNFFQLNKFPSEKDWS
jgi:hypothetical protein